MKQTFLFEELDESTRKYLKIVRQAEGKGMPGMFSSAPSGFAGCSLLAGLILVPLTLLLTLTNWFGIIFQEPIAVALLQTAGLVLGGWLLIAFRRTYRTSGNEKMAGHWVYLDALNLYEAYREQVTVTSLQNVAEASYTHKYNDGKYQNSVVRIIPDDRKAVSFTVNDELRAEQIVIFVNYLAWARGPESDTVKDLSPLQLGALARYVARYDKEPRDADGNLSLSLLDLNLDLDGPPKHPSREGGASPSVLPYVAILAAAILVFAAMAFAVNPIMRDEALFDAVMQRPTEPRVLRAYLVDSRNTMHREEVLDELAIRYEPVMNYIHKNAQQTDLQRGMLAILKNLSREPEQPVVSLRVTERSPAAIAGGAGERVKKLRESLVGGDGVTGINREGILDLFARISPAVAPDDGKVFETPPPPIGHQLIVFVEPPADARNAHIDIVYELKPTSQDNVYTLQVTIDLRESIDGDAIVSYTKDLMTVAGDSPSLARAIDLIRANAIRWMIGDKDPNSPIEP